MNFALFLVDINGLKKVNDVYGHQFGNKLIVETTNILVQVFGHDNVYRIGGDEFVALLPYESGLSGDIYVHKLRKACAEFNRNSKKDFYVELSAGYTVFVCGGEVDFNEILSSSDKMLYEAKQTRRQSIKKKQ